MLLSGFTFIRNALKYDFPIRECIESMLPVVDELVVNVGKSEDGTERLLSELAASSPKIRLVHSVWDDSKTDRGLVLSEQTNIALEACRGRWALYLQADEALHEAEHAAIRAAVEAADRDPEPVDGLCFRYLHFYGGYTLVQRPWNWYPSEIRLVRRASGARSYGDAQTFRLGPDDRELKTRLLDAHVFHYGHARAPELMKRKISYFHRFWHGDAHGIAVDAAYALDWKNLVWYWGTHPAPYAARVKAGLEWSPRPAQLIDPSSIARVVLAHNPGQAALAGELAALLRALKPGLEVIVSEAPLGHPRGGTVLVDLAAEDRDWISAGALLFLSRSRFAWTVAHAPGGFLSPWRARRYQAVNWGCHQTASQGFRVPDRDQARQLARWMGLDPEAADRRR